MKEKVSHLAKQADIEMWIISSKKAYLYLV